MAVPYISINLTW